MNELDRFHGPNAGYVLELYDRYLLDPESVDDATRAAFDDWARQLPSEDTQQAPMLHPIQAESPMEEPLLPAGLSPVELDKVVGAARLIRIIREYGHLAAHVDPLGAEPPGDVGLQMETHNVQEADLAALPTSVVSGPLFGMDGTLLDVVHLLREMYCGAIGYDFDQVQDAGEREWLQDVVESRRFAVGGSAARELLERLTEVESFERFLHKAFPGQKWFSIEGLDMLVPMLDEIIQRASATGTREVVIGIAHRGRLNVMAHILGQPYETIIGQFLHTAKRARGTAASDSTNDGWTGDVKYHLGATRRMTKGSTQAIPITLPPNPSHLEFVNAVVEGRARAAQETRDQPGPPRQDGRASLAIIIHGDAAFPGQGVVAETLNLSRLHGYRTGGTIHIIANNQLGFTTDPIDARSTLYAGDLAKGFEIPVVHVNADSPADCLMSARVAEAYREEFQKDFLIDLIGYRRHGHNESDEPAFTQPRMYEKVSRHPTVRDLLAERLVSQGEIEPDEVRLMSDRAQERLRTAQRRAMEAAERPAPDEREPDDGKARPSPPAGAVADERLLLADELRTLNEQLLGLPESFTLNTKLQRALGRRRDLIESGSIDWAHAESLAFAAILADGTPIRLTGQDTERGTFSQRHLVLHDVKSGERFIPHQSIAAARASFAVYNSPLSENAALAFEYGYSAHAPSTLVLWEAQFGDFINGAQVIVDQFIVSGQAKWRQRSGLVLLLPHGYEGQGPEHSSARLERFLQLAANDNIRVANITTSAQYYHLLRRQAASLASDPRPLVVMTPKSLLRNPKAASSIEELADVPFQSILADDRGKVIEATRLVVCSGKVYVDLVMSPQYEAAQDVVVVRVEELYPFPERELREVLETYPHIEEIVWTQEEPQNMGAWAYLSQRLGATLPQDVVLGYVGRPELASPAEGSIDLHNAEQSRIVEAALIGKPDHTVAPRREGVKHG